jgi:RHS repeat-associated protein
VKDGVTETTRYVSSIAGDLSLTYSVEDEFLSTGIIDPQGSVVATTSKQQVVDGAAATVWSGLSFFDEYGNRINSKTTNTGALDYAWLGGKERATDTTGLVLMGVRLYNSVTGHFTSVDPVKGGNTTRYAYPQDPINKYDLDGRIAWRKWTKRAVSVAGIVAVDACVVATAGICGVAAGAASIASTYYGYKKKEMTGRQAAVSMAIDAVGMALPGIRAIKRLPGAHSRAGQFMQGARKNKPLTQGRKITHKSYGILAAFIHRTVRSTVRAGYLGYYGNRSASGLR